MMTLNNFHSFPQLKFHNFSATWATQSGTFSTVQSRIRSSAWRKDYAFTIKYSNMCSFFQVLLGKLPSQEGSFSDLESFSASLLHKSYCELLLLNSFPFVFYLVLVSFPLDLIYPFYIVNSNLFSK